ncbi:MAG TPA: cytochrome c oxidase subunit II [Casimicrobiaceae bacterium]|nr:cytochrome c oxidase subunit II [Casimicrobiaceae bacterium]
MDFSRVSLAMKRLQRAFAAIVLSLAAGSSLLAHAAERVSGSAWWFQEPVTAIARQQIDLHNYILLVCVIIFVGVFGVMFYSIFKHRKSVGHQAAQFHENTFVEIIWTVIPFLILVFMAYPATKTILSYKDTGAPELTIKVTGYQWKWSYDYLQDGFGFFSNLATPLAQREDRAPKGENYLLEVDNPLVVPVDTKVRVLITAADVLHAWWVPAFGVKQDAIPGFVRDVWFRAEKVGTYRGQCAELCGKEHGFMPIVVDVKSKEDYAKWAADQKAKVAAIAGDPNKKWEVDELSVRGQRVYTSNCVACHQANGKGVPNAFPGLDGSKLVRGPKADHIAIVLHGKQGTAMPSYTQLSDLDVAAVITYERNAWSNKTGDAVQPSEIKAARR